MCEDGDGDHHDHQDDHGGSDEWVLVAMVVAAMVDVRCSRGDRQRCDGRDAGIQPCSKSEIASQMLNPL